MAYPSDGLEAVYRNPIKSVAAYLDGIVSEIAATQALMDAAAARLAALQRLHDGVAGGVNRTSALPASRATDAAVTPGTPRSAASTVPTHALHVMPPTENVATDPAATAGRAGGADEPPEHCVVLKRMEGGTLADTRRCEVSLAGEGALLGHSSP